jgi:hypothetical protein
VLKMHGEITSVIVQKIAFFLTMSGDSIETKD